MNSQSASDQDKNIEDTEQLKMGVASEEDTEGHRNRPGRAPAGLDSDEEDTEGHRNRPGR